MRQSFKKKSAIPETPFPQCVHTGSSLQATRVVCQNSPPVLSSLPTTTKLLPQAIIVRVLCIMGQNLLWNWNTAITTKISPTDFSWFLTPQSLIIRNSICIFYFCIWNSLFCLKQRHPLPLMLIGSSFVGHSSISKRKIVEVAVTSCGIMSSTLHSLTTKKAAFYLFSRISRSNLCYQWFSSRPVHVAQLFACWDNRVD